MGCTASVEGKRDVTEPPIPLCREIREPVDELCEKPAVLEAKITSLLAQPLKHAEQLSNHDAMLAAAKRGMEVLGLEPRASGLQRCVLGIGSFALYTLAARRREDVNDALHALFRKYDTTSSGVLTQQQLELCLRECGVVLSDSDITILALYACGDVPRVDFPSFCAPLLDVLASELLNDICIRHASLEQLERLLRMSLHGARSVEDVADVVAGLGIPHTVVAFVASTQVSDLGDCQPDASRIARLLYDTYHVDRIPITARACRTAQYELRMAGCGTDGAVGVTGAVLSDALAPLAGSCAALGKDATEADAEAQFEMQLSQCAVALSAQHRAALRALRRVNANGAAFTCLDAVRVLRYVDVRNGATAHMQRAFDDTQGALRAANTWLDTAVAVAVSITRKHPVPARPSSFFNFGRRSRKVAPVLPSSPKELRVQMEDILDEENAKKQLRPPPVAAAVLRPMTVSDAADLIAVYGSDSASVGGA
eukprot:TRINITY_DN6971_c0_g1_i1.p1 TRINITY_DN6971_c0_g1~~TRINITY_DN6971_c0_g1_i1.p1  ORF type:complete len:483 (+),score=104.28 TRINITY_DN6971_c0_g1_i1:120-1568(+)